MKRSEERLYTNSIKQLRDLTEAEINLDTLPPAKFIFENILKSDDETVSKTSEVNRTEESEESEDGDMMSDSQTPGQILRVYNKKLLLDESKKRALLSCAQCPPVSIIQGPPGTGETADKRMFNTNYHFTREDHMPGGCGAESRGLWAQGAGGYPQSRRL